MEFFAPPVNFNGGFLCLQEYMQIGMFGKLLHHSITMVYITFGSEVYYFQYSVLVYTEKFRNIFSIKGIHAGYGFITPVEVTAKAINFI